MRYEKSHQLPSHVNTWPTPLYRVYWVYNWTKSHVYKMKLTLSQSRVGTEGWESVTGLWGSSEVRGSQPSHSRGVATGVGRREGPPGFGHRTQSLALRPGQTDGWKSKSPRNHPAQGAQGLLHLSSSHVVGPDLDSGAGAKGRQQSRREGGDTDVWWPGASGPMAEGGQGSGLAATGN